MNPDSNADEINQTVTRGSEVFSVEVDSFQTREQAEKLYDELSLKGYSVRIKELESTDKKDFHVLMGRFDTAEAVTPLLEKMRDQEGFPNSKLHMMVDER